jgi:hypothetical protein
MERLVVLRPEHADLSREFSSSFPLRGLVHSGEASGQLLASYGGSSPRNRSPARVLEECIDISRPPFPILQVRPQWIVVAAWQPGNCSGTEIGF